MSSEEEDDSIDVDSPRPPIMLMQDAYDVSRDFFFFLKKGIKEGGHFEWYEAAQAKAKELAAKTSSLKPDINSSSKTSGGAQTGEPGSCSVGGGGGFVAGLTHKLANGGCAVYDSCCWATHKCGQTCTSAKQSVGGAVTSVTSKFSRSSAVPDSSSATSSGGLSEKPVVVGPPPTLPPGFEPSHAADKLASIIMKSPKPATVDDSPAVVEDDGKPKREVKDFLNELPHAKRPDYPAAFYNLGPGSVAPPPAPPSASSTTIFLQPQKKRVQPQPDSFEENHNHEGSHQPSIPPVRRFEPSVPHDTEPVHNHSAIRTDHNHHSTPFGGGGSGVGHSDHNAQPKFSSGNMFAPNKFVGSGGGAINASKPSGASAVPCLSTWAPSGFVGRPGAGPGMDLIDDTIASFEAQYQKMEGGAGGGGGGGPIVNGFGAIPPPFSQSTREHHQPSSFYTAKPFRGGTGGGGVRGYSPPSPQHDPARSAFTPPRGSKYSPQPAAPAPAPTFSPSSDNNDHEKPNVRQARSQWPPPSNAMGAAYEKEDITKVRQEYQNQSYDQEEPYTRVSHPLSYQEKEPAHHPSYLVDEPYLEQEVYNTMRPRDPSPPPPPVPHHRQEPPSYQQYSSRTRTFSPNLYSAPRPFSPNYDAPKPFSPVSRTFDTLGHGGMFDSGHATSSHSFGKPSYTNFRSPPAPQNGGTSLKITEIPGHWAQRTGNREHYVQEFRTPRAYHAVFRSK